MAFGPSPEWRHQARGDLANGNTLRYGDIQRGHGIDRNAETRVPGVGGAVVVMSHDIRDSLQGERGIR